MNIILLALSAMLGIAIVVLMNRRELLKAYEAESRAADHEMMYDKVVAFVVGVAAAFVVIDALFGMGVGWLIAAEFLIILVAGFVMVHRLRRQRAVLATCIDLRERRKATNRQSP